MVSGVGRDVLGERGIAAIESHGIDCRHVQADQPNYTN